MTEAIETLAARIEARFPGAVERLPSVSGELGFEVPAGKLLEVCAALRDEPEFRFEQLIDVCGLDYLTYGEEEWKTDAATRSGFSRAVDRHPVEAVDHPRRYAASYQLLSIAQNARVRLRAYCPDDELPVLPSVAGIWASANWFEREAFDMFGILFEGHPDLRRILTDYGFLGYPFRKDFPLSGNVEVRYDPEKRRVVYEPVSIEPRTLVPRVIRHDHRYDEAFREKSGDA